MIKIFIEEIVKKIWREETELYNTIYNRIIETNIWKVYEETIEEIRKNAVNGIESKEYTETILETMGCTYCCKKGVFCGCSMCDWDSLLINMMAHMSVLRKRNIDLYAKAVRFSFSYIRGEQVRGNTIEEIAVHNAFCDWQMPNEVIKELFENNSVYERTPAVGILQARASSINIERICQWKKIYKKVVSIGIGVECSDEWLRIHWLNKGINNKQIIDALHLIKEGRCNTNANVLLGMPGFTERQSIEEFEETIGWLYNNPDVDLITVSPLVTRRKTIQGVLKNISDRNAEPITLISMFKALYNIVNKYPGVESKIVLSPPNCQSFFEQSFIYKGGRYQKLEENIISFLKPLIRIGSSNLLKQIIYSDIIKDAEYKSYNYDIYKQPGRMDLKEQLLKIAELISCTLFGDKSKDISNIFKNELAKWKIISNYYFILK